MILHKCIQLIYILGADNLQNNSHGGSPLRVLNLVVNKMSLFASVMSLDLASFFFFLFFFFATNYTYVC